MKKKISKKANKIKQSSINNLLFGVNKKISQPKKDKKENKIKTDINNIEEIKEENKNEININNKNKNDHIIIFMKYNYIRIKIRI